MYITRYAIHGTYAYEVTTVFDSHGTSVKETTWWYHHDFCRTSCQGFGDSPNMPKQWLFRYTCYLFGVVWTIIYIPRDTVLLLMEEPGMYKKPCKYWDKLPTSTGAGFQASTVSIQWVSTNPTNELQKLISHSSVRQRPPKGSQWNHIFFSFSSLFFFEVFEAQWFEPHISKKSLRYPCRVSLSFSLSLSMICKYIIIYLHTILNRERYTTTTFVDHPTRFFHICTYLEPKWPLFWLEFGPCFGGLTFENRGRVGF